MLYASLGSCLLLAAKFNDDMKRDKIKELIEVIIIFFSNICSWPAQALKKGLETFLYVIALDSCVKTYNYY